MAVKEYLAGSVVTLTNLAVNEAGNPVDVTDITLRLLSPGRVETEIGAEDITHVTTGSYRYDLYVTEAGRWHYRFETSDPNGADEGEFHVRSHGFDLGGLPVTAPVSGAAATFSAGNVYFRPKIIGTPAVQSNGMATVIQLSQASSASSADGWTLRADTVSVAITGYSISGTTLTLYHDVVFTAGAPYLVGVTLEYASGPGTVIANVGGLEMSDVAEFSITNGSSRTPPTYSSGEIESAGGTALLTFSEAMNTGVSATLGFSYLVTPSAGAPFALTITGGVYVDSTHIRHTFSETVFDGDSIAISYNDATGDVEASVGGADMVSFSGAPVTNNSARDYPQVSSVAILANGLTARITFDENINTGSDKLLGFQYYADGSPVSIAFGTFTSATILDHTLASLVYEIGSGADKVITLDYSKAAGDIVDTEHGDELQSFTARSVTNGSTVDPLYITAAAVGATGLTVVITCSENLNTGVGAPTGSSLSVNGSAHTISSAAYGPGASQLTLTLASAIFNTDTATLDYTPGNVVALSGSVLVAENDYPVDVTAAPGWTPAYLSGIVDYGYWNDSANLSSTTGGAYGDVTDGVVVRRWRGHLGALTFTDSYGWADWGHHVMTTQGIRAPLDGSSTGFSVSRALAYNAAATLAIGVLHVSSASSSKFADLTYYKGGGTPAVVMSVLADDDNGRSARNGSGSWASVSVRTPPITYPVETMAIAVTSGANTTDVYAGGLTDDQAGGANTGSATILYLRQSSLGDRYGDATTCPRLLFWVVSDGAISALDRGRLETWMAAQSVLD